MRRQFINTLTELARKDNKIFLLTGDLGFSFFEEFRKNFPKRFFNIGVAEANMVGIAAGLALSGKIVFIYSIAPFATMRCFEQIRNDLCYQNLNVRIVGVGGGLCYGSAGMTHHSIEDIAIMKALPNMTVVCPGDPLEVEMAVKATVSWRGPVYLRLGRGNEPRIHSDISNFKIGRGIIIKNGNEITIMSTGNILHVAKQVTDKLTNKGISVRLISMHTIKPLDKKVIIKSNQETKAIFIIEEHSLIGGLGSSVSEVLAEENVKKILFKRFSLPDAYCKDIGNHKYLREKNALSVEQITNNILEIYESIKG